jgi:hypothetical protein
LRGYYILTELQLFPLVDCKIVKSYIYKKKEREKKERKREREREREI